MARVWGRLELHTLLLAAVLQALQLWVMYRGLPSDPDFLVLPLGGLFAVQAWFGMLPYLMPAALIPYGLVLGLWGFLGFGRLAQGRLRTCVCGGFYYLLLLLTWPLIYGVGCPTCVS